MLVSPVGRNGLRARRAQPGVMTSTALVPDAIDGAGEIVGYQQRAVRELCDVDGPAKIFAVLGEPAVGEHFGLVGGAVVLEPGEHHPRADRRGPVPGTVLGR